MVEDMIPVMWQFCGRPHEQKVNRRTRVGGTAHQTAWSATLSFPRSTGSGPPRRPVKSHLNGPACLVAEGHENRAAGFSTTGRGDFRPALGGLRPAGCPGLVETFLSRNTEPFGSGFLRGIAVTVLVCGQKPSLATSMIWVRSGWPTNGAGRGGDVRASVFLRHWRPRGASWERLMAPLSPGNSFSSWLFPRVDHEASRWREAPREMRRGGRLCRD